MFDVWAALLELRPTMDFKDFTYLSNEGGEKSVSILCFHMSDRIMLTEVTNSLWFATVQV